MAESQGASASDLATWHSEDDNQPADNQQADSQQTDNAPQEMDTGDLEVTLDLVVRAAAFIRDVDEKVTKIGEIAKTLQANAVQKEIAAIARIGELERLVSELQNRAVESDRMLAAERLHAEQADAECREVQSRLSRLQAAISENFGALADRFTPR
jgi:hypothetical protein